MSDPTGGGWDGYPENRDRDGWHMLSHPNTARPGPAAWSAEHGAWCDDSGMHTPRGVVELGLRYEGPVFTLAEVAEREASAWESARDAAARRAGDKGIGEDRERALRAHLARAIRALTPPVALSSALAERDRRVRAEALEEAARVADHLRDEWRTGIGQRGGVAYAEAIAAAIRALRERGA